MGKQQGAGAWRGLGCVYQEVVPGRWAPRGYPVSSGAALAAGRGHVEASRAARTCLGEGLGLMQPAVCFSLVCAGHLWSPPALLITVFPPACLAAPVKALGCGNSPRSRRCLAQSACSGGSRGFSAVLPTLYPWERAGEVKGV